MARYRIAYSVLIGLVGVWFVANFVNFGVYYHKDRPRYVTYSFDIYDTDLVIGWWNTRFVPYSSEIEGVHGLEIGHYGAAYYPRSWRPWNLTRLVPRVWYSAEEGYYGDIRISAHYLPWISVVIAGMVGRRRYSRSRSGRCIACGYDLSGNPGAPCPECGVNPA